jgi:hypothetical protein
LFETLAPTEKYICKTDKGDVVSDPVFSYTGELPNGIEFNPSNGRMYGTPLELDILGTEITISVSSPSFPDLTSNIKKTDIYIDYPLPIPQPPANLLLIFTTTGILILLIVLAVVLLFWIL